MRNNLIIKEPELYFDSIHQELDNFLRDTFFTHSFAHPLNIIKNTVLRPAIEVKQDKEKYIIKAQIPGVKKENIDIELDNDFLTLSAEINEENTTNTDDNDLKYHTTEFRYGKYQRTISFDNPIKLDEVKANYKDGILNITLPKQLTEIKNSKKIPIE